MLFKGTIGSAQSGKLNGLVASHNKGGSYWRSYTIPTNPNTDRQAGIRANFGALANTWSNVLTQSQRDSWAAYAAAVPLINRLGESRTVPPLAMFIRCNAPRLLAGLPRVDQAPDPQSLSVFHLPQIDTITTGATPTATIEVNREDTWNIQGGNGAMLVFASAPVNATINFFRGPYQFQGIVTPGGQDTVNFPLLRPLGTDQKVFFRFIATTDDGRLSQELFGSFPSSDVAPVGEVVTLTSAVSSEGGAASDTLTLHFDQPAFVSVTFQSGQITVSGGQNLTALTRINASTLRGTFDADTPAGQTVTLQTTAGMVLDNNFLVPLPQEVQST